MGIGVAGCLIALIAADVFGLRTAFARARTNSEVEERGDRSTSADHATTTGVKSAEGNCASLVVVAVGGFIVGMLTATAVTSDADLTALRWNGMMLLLYLGTTLICGISSIIASQRVVNGEGRGSVSPAA